MKSEVQLYLDNTFNLARSLVIKSLDTVILTNKYLIASFGNEAVDLEDSTTWKYYLNLFGEYYSVTIDAVVIPVDVPMLVESLDTGNTISFDKITLIDHPTTLFSYKNNRSRLRNLINTYPGQEILINGILYPVELETAINAEDMKILEHHTGLVDINEISLMDDLQEWIYSYDDRWANRAYTLTDNLYLAGQLSVLYLNLVPRILNIRLSKCLTEEAHSFHIRCYLRSHHGLDIDVDSMNLELRLWLYKNIAFLERNIGKQSTIEEVIQHLFIDRDFIVNKYNLKQIDTNILKEIYGTPDYHFEKTEIIKDSVTLGLGLIDDLDSVLSKETFSIEDGGYYGPISRTREREEIDKKIALTRDSVIGTKLVEVVTNKLHNIPPITLTQLVLDSWMDAVINKNYNVGIEFIDPETKLVYTVNQQQALLIFASYVASYFKIEEALVPIWRISMSFKYGITLNDLNTYTNRTDTFNDVLINYTIGVLDPNGLSSVSEFNDYVESLFPMFNYSWITAYTANDYIDAGTYRNSIDYMFQRKEVNFGSNNTITIKDQLGSENIVISKKNNHNYIKSIEELVKVCTGYKIDTTFLLKKEKDVHMAFFKELTSYSVQNLSGISVDKLQTEVRINNSILKITKKPVRHVYKPQLTINFDDVAENYTYIDNECDSILLAASECEDLNYILGTDDIIPPEGAIELHPMLDIVSADDRAVHLSVRTSNYETLIV